MTIRLNVEVVLSSQPDSGVPVPGLVTQYCRFGDLPKSSRKVFLGNLTYDDHGNITTLAGAGTPIQFNLGGHDAPNTWFVVQVDHERHAAGRACDGSHLALWSHGRKATPRREARHAEHSPCVRLPWQNRMRATGRGLGI